MWTANDSLHASPFPLDLDSTHCTQQYSIFYLEKKFTIMATKGSIGFQNFWCLRRFWATLIFDPPPPPHTHTNINTGPSECVLFGCGFEFYLLPLTNIPQEPMFYLKQNLTIIVRKFWASQSPKYNRRIRCTFGIFIACLQSCGKIMFPVVFPVCLSLYRGLPMMPLSITGHMGTTPNPSPPLSQPSLAWPYRDYPFPTPVQTLNVDLTIHADRDVPPPHPQGSWNLFTNSPNCWQTGGWHLTEMPSC